MNLSVPPSASSLQPLVRLLADDLLSRAAENAAIDAGLRQAFRQIEKGGRTAQAFEVWREDYLDQVAAAWVLACVFVRFLSDGWTTGATGAATVPSTPRLRT